MLARILQRVQFDQGLVARFLFTMPPNTPKTWTDAVIAEEAKQEMVELFGRLLALDFADEGGEAAPVALPCCQEALEVFKGRYNDFAKFYQEDLPEGNLQAAAAKLEAYAARFALLIHVITVVVGGQVPTQETPVDRASMEAGWDLAYWFLNEAERVYMMLQRTECDARNQRLIDYMGKKKESMSVRDIQRAKIQGWDNADEIREALHKLVAAHLVVLELPGGNGNPGRRAGPRFRLKKHPTPDTNR